MSSEEVLAILKYLWLSPEAKRRADAESKAKQDEVTASYYREDGWKIRPSPFFEPSYVYRPYFLSSTV
jgi:hypothetical protein